MRRPLRCETRRASAAIPIGAAAACLALALLACGTDARESNGDPPAAPDDEARAVEPSPEDAPRGPSGAGAVACEGASDDPSQIALFARTAADGDLAAAIRGLEALAGAHPGSATARVRLGELVLRDQPPQPALAMRWFDRALALHERGCALADPDLWRALEGAALSRMMQGEYGAAVPLLERSLARWPDVPATRYNLACARCQTGDVDACAEELERLMAWSGEVPPFLREQVRDRAHYARLARTDPDLAPLRADRARFDALLAPADAP